MDLKIYNTLTRKKEPFEPMEPGHVKMYVCGVTTYDRCHIGHARSAVVFDAFVRYLQHKGYKVHFVRNFTDIDDKIIKRANEEGISSSELSEREIRHFYEDMARLKVMPASFEPRATEHIKEIVRLIETLISKEYAYEADGDVYFSVRHFPAYGALSGRNIEELVSGARVAIGERKKDPLDFALWKAAKPGEPSWQSPWGAGRPGWHIECSAMGMKYLGPTLDIHGGGLDLIFPHHENEIAQSEAATGKTFVRYWIHNGFVTINGEKMSKSLGNFITIHEILKTHSPEALRLFLLSKHYRSPLDYSEEALNEMEAALDRCYNTICEAKNKASRATKATKKMRPLSDVAEDAVKSLRALPERFDQAMDDDFNTAQAMGYLFEAVRALNRLAKECERTPSILCTKELEAGIGVILNASHILGVLEEEPDAYINARNLEGLKRFGLTEEEILSAIEERTAARAKKDWAAADRIRKGLEAKGIMLKDTPEGTRWAIKSFG
ncbi:cysteine--tRNA ligase [Dissulfurimicrobium hydrothermale]|uniref:cysteine--tRNA ligase n=1 Tax=Dissulfurimicrobium hydrothermale TaxID=1750598 RepID=UPI001EDB9FFA|nr:cysteine--tRNA ligase [Dissulfurimicrobium hydrothermale]UKL14186.1 cysteine--tRNA ligase [Dissulfurimicrobium hydrothermale]